MIFYISIIISIITLIIATYTDLKERIVTNKLNFGTTIIGLIIFATYSIYIGNIWPIMYSFFGMCFGFFFGWALWKIGVFAGGDVKLFMALGALNPFTPALIKIGIFTNSSLPIFPISLFLYSLIAFLPYGLVVIFTRLMQNKEFRKKITKDIFEKSKQSFHASIIIASIHTIFFIFLNNYFLELITIFLALIIWNKLKNKKIIITLILVIISLILNHNLFLQIFIGIAITLVIIYGLAKLMFSFRPLLSKEIKVSELEEGMIPTKTLIWKGKKVIEFELSFKGIIQSIKKGKINELFPKKEIISSNKARGLTIEELKEVQKLAKKGLIKNKISIKDSMPFVPTILIGYAISLFAGDAILIILGL